MELDLSSPVQEAVLSHGWVARIGLTRSSAAQLAGWATLSRAGRPRARLVLSQLGNDPVHALEQLRMRSEEWVLEWSTHAHSGDTHFGDLSQ